MRNIVTDRMDTSPSLSLERQNDVILMKGITKKFPAVLGNDQVDFSLREGEIHTLLGENGAGKTTLTNILYGLLQPDEGEIFVRGKCVSIRSPQDAMRLGIGMVHQSFKLFETLSVAENIFYGLNPAGRFYVNPTTLHHEAEALLMQYNIQVNPATPVQQLPLGVRQKIEIAKTLYRGAEILILDEPTAVLTPQETKDLFRILRGMVKEGRSIIFISHKLEEVLEISDRITVMRKGKVISTIRRDEADKAGLAKMMVGRDVFFQLERQPVTSQQKILEVKNLWVTGEVGLPSVRDCTFAVSGFEIFAIAGVAGNGQRELVEALTGMRPVQKGRFSVDGRNLANRSPRNIRKAGLRAIPEDRDRNGLILDFTVTENFILTQTYSPPFVRKGFLDRRAAEEFSKGLIEEYNIYTPQAGVTIKTLSGGNRQKVLLARELSQDFRVLIVSEPTRGLDVGATEYVRKKILEQREKGVAILLVSSDLEEILCLSDRLAVMYEGRFAGVMETSRANVEALGLWMTGSSS